MDSAATTLVPAIWGEALKSWGAYALVLMLLGAICWQLMKRLAAKDAELAGKDTQIAALRAEISTLQERRVQDASTIIKVTEAATAMIASRGQGDKTLADLLSVLTDEIAALKEWMREVLGPRRTRAR